LTSKAFKGLSRKPQRQWSHFDIEYTLLAKYTQKQIEIINQSQINDVNLEDPYDFEWNNKC
jgi:hypothetical protein